MCPGIRSVRLHSLNTATNSKAPTSLNVGFFGETSGIIENIHVDVTVHGDFSVSGLVGYQDGGTITNSYATGSVTGYIEIGEQGTGNGSISDSYFDTTTTGQSQEIRNSSQTGTTGDEDASYLLFLGFRKNTGYL